MTCGKMEFDINTISTIVGLLVGGGGLLYYKQTNRNKKLENDGILFSQYKELVEELKAERKEMKEERDQQKAFYESEIKRLVESNATKRAEKIELQKKLDEKNSTIDTLNSEVARLEVMKCEVHGCGNRKPPSGY